MTLNFSEADFKINLNNYNIKARGMIKKTACPYCGIKDISKYGYTAKGRKRYKCKSCGRTFCDTTGTPVHNSKKSINKWIEYIDYMSRNETLRDISSKLKISLTTAFQWRHKVLNAIQNKMFDVKFYDKVEIGESVMRKNYKGNHHGKLDYKDSYPEIRILSCIDDRNRMVRGIDEPFIRKANLDHILKGRIKKNSIITTARNMSYTKFAYENNLKINMVTLGRMNKYSDLNNKRANLQGRRFWMFTRKFYGVATRYVNFYSVFYVLRLINDNNYEYIFRDLINRFFLSTEILREKDFKNVKLC